MIVLSLTAGGTRPAEHPAGGRGCGRRGAAGPAPQPSCRRRLRPAGLSSLGGPGVAGVTGGGPAMGGGRTCWFSLCAKHLEIVLLSLDSGVKDFAADTARRDRAQEPRRGDPRGARPRTPVRGGLSARGRGGAAHSARRGPRFALADYGEIEARSAHAWPGREVVGKESAPERHRHAAGPRGRGSCGYCANVFVRSWTEPA